MVSLATFPSFTFLLMVFPQPQPYKTPSQNGIQQIDEDVCAMIPDIIGVCMVKKSDQSNGQRNRKDGFKSSDIRFAQQ